MEQHKLSPGRLLNLYGNLNESGYATSLVKEYYRNDIKANKMRIKEWDYYYVGNNDFGIALTIADNSYMGLGSVSILDFTNKSYITRSKMTLFPKGKTNLPQTSKEGNVSFHAKGVDILFENDGISRKLKAYYKKFKNGIDLSCEIELYDEPEESMVIATPFAKRKHFYYNQKINCMRAKGKVVIGGKLYKFTPDHSFACLDWGRGVWTYKNTWYWSSVSTLLEGVKIGFNLGYGFGANNKASENMLYYDGVAYKIEEVTFHIPKKDGKDDFMSPWKITSSDGSVDLDFVPILNRKDHTNALIIESKQNQVFGQFSGYLRFGERLMKVDDLIGFAEKVTNRW